MHSAVMQNKKYIQFAAKNTVEVLALGSLDRAIESKDPKAATYTAKSADGKPVEYMLKWPGLTADDINSLHRSKARTYNNTGGIPYTCIVDPHTLEEMHHWSGGTSANSIMDQVMVARKKLTKAHGAGLKRADLAFLADSESEITELLGAGSYKKALRLVASVEKKSLPQSLSERVAAMRESVLTAASQRIDDLASQAQSDLSSARRDLKRLLSELRGTDLVTKAQEVLDSLG